MCSSTLVISLFASHIYDPTRKMYWKVEPTLERKSETKFRHDLALAILKYELQPGSICVVKHKMAIYAGFPYGMTQYVKNMCL